jgi:hypothetical protein
MSASRVTLGSRGAPERRPPRPSRSCWRFFARIKPALRKSITFNNDPAFAPHGCRRARAPWPPGSAMLTPLGGVANANGRLRRWLPRLIDIDRRSDEEIQDIVITVNRTPRKCLGFKSPSRRSSKSLAKTPKSAWLEPVALRARIHETLSRLRSTPPLWVARRTFGLATDAGLRRYVFRRQYLSRPWVDRPARPASNSSPCCQAAYRASN